MWLILFDLQTEEPSYGTRRRRLFVQLRDRLLWLEDLRGLVQRSSHLDARYWIEGRRRKGLQCVGKLLNVAIKSIMLFLSDQG